MTRDPRIDPKPGDVLKKNGILREVTYRNTKFAWCRCSRSNKHTWMLLPYIGQWRKWAATAEVVKVAE